MTRPEYGYAAPDCKVPPPPGCARDEAFLFDMHLVNGPSLSIDHQSSKRLMACLPKFCCTGSNKCIGSSWARKAAHALACAL